MQTDFSEDQNSFRQVVARFLADKSQTVTVRKLMATDTGYDAQVWRQLCGELGLAGMHIPEQYGGSGFGPVELGIVAEEMGRHLYCGPFFASSVMAGYAILDAATEAHKEDLLPRIASGALIATLVIDNLNDVDRAGQSLMAAPVGSGGSYTLSGAASIVLDAAVAERLIVIAGSDTGIGLFSLARDDKGVTVTPRQSMDLTRKLSSLGFDSAIATRIGSVDRSTLSLLWDQLSCALAHEMIGGAQALFESTLDYTKLRVQFGRPIGSFQALKHRCADLLVEVELAKAATHHAARCLAANEGEPWAASMAKAMAADTYTNVAIAAIQLRGGIGFTWEEDTHLWFKRARSSEVFLGQPHVHRERMMTMIEDAADA